MDDLHEPRGAKEGDDQSAISQCQFWGLASGVQLVSSSARQGLVNPQRYCVAGMPSTCKLGVRRVSPPFADAS